MILNCSSYYTSFQEQYFRPLHRLSNTNMLFDNKPNHSCSSKYHDSIYMSFVFEKSIIKHTNNNWTFNIVKDSAWQNLVKWFKKFMAQ